MPARAGTTNCCVKVGARPGGTGDLHLAPQRFDPIPSAHTAARAVSTTDAIVTHVDDQAAVPGLDAELGVCRLRVLHHVGERLGDEEVGCRLDVWGIAFVACGDLDRQRAARGESGCRGADSPVREDARVYSVPAAVKAIASSRTAPSDLMPEIRSRDRRPSAAAREVERAPISGMIPEPPAANKFRRSESYGSHRGSGDPHSGARGRGPPIFREGLIRLLEGDGFEVVAAAGNAEDVVRKTRAHHPDVVIVDIQMPPDLTDDGLGAALEIRANDPEVGVLVLDSPPGGGTRVCALLPIADRG